MDQIIVVHMDGATGDAVSAAFVGLREPPGGKGPWFRGGLLKPQDQRGKSLPNMGTNGIYRHWAQWACLLYGWV
jgi:hypothetical protein